MGKILGIRIQNYGSLKDVKMGRLFSDQSGEDLDNMVADAFGVISDCPSADVETACDASHRGGYDQLVSQGADAPIHFEIYYRETSNARPITYELTINKDDENRPYVEEERLRQRRQGNSYGRPRSFLYLIRGQGYAFEGADGGQEDGGRERMKKDCPTYVERGKRKREWAVNIGRHMCPDANVSPSFRYFLNEIRKRILRAKE